jgi:hypothetical protein
MNESTTPSRKPVRVLRILLIIAACVITIIALFYAEENFRGKSAWEKFKRTEEARGEKFDYSAFVPPPVPDDQNFAMTPLLRATFDYIHTTNGIRWRDTNAWQRLSGIRIDLQAHQSNKKAPDTEDWEQSALANLDKIANFYRGNTNYPQSTGTNAAEVILTALNKFEPDLKELRDAAAARPFSRFPIEYDNQPTFAILLPHLASVKGIVSMCELRAVAELELHKTDDAFADLQLAFRMSDSVHHDPFLIDHLVRLACLSTTMQGIREGIARHAWSDAQLDGLEKYLASLDLLADYEHTMRSELVFHIRGLEYLRGLGIKNNTPFDISQTEKSLPAFNWMPGGWYDQNLLVLGEFYRDYLLPVMDETNRLVKPGLTSEMSKSLEQLRVGPYNILAKMLLPALGRASLRSSRTQTFVDETRVACALERYRIAHQEVPDSLATLTPRFLPRIPTDLFDGQPLRYKKTGPDAYMIYSLGWNEKDDGGVVALKTGTAPKADATEGDWVWQFPPKSF